jgi:hypothetical protein
MGTTRLDITGDKFLINGKLTYSEIENSSSNAHGLLMNARLIQGIFDDAAEPARFARFGREQWDAERNTDDLIAALPQWYQYGLRAFTVGCQGGGPCFTIPNSTIDNNPFGEDGTSFAPKHAARLDRLINAADRIGMTVIVSYLYQGQSTRLRDGRSIRNAVTTASRFLRDGGYTNVIVEVANEQNGHGNAMISTPEGMAALIDLARAESGGLPVGCSGTGGVIARDIIEASDVVLIHGNGQTRQFYRNLVDRARGYGPGKPLVCNEDSQALGNLQVAFDTQSSWGYYNNITKQEPPIDYGITPGEDAFFAHRMAMGIGISTQPIAPEDQYYLQGLEPEMTWEGKRWVRLASLHPESIDFVRFFRDDALVFTCYDEPFTVNFVSNWRQGPVENPRGTWKAVVHLGNGDTVEKVAHCG